MAHVFFVRMNTGSHEKEIVRVGKGLLVSVAIMRVIRYLDEKER